MYRGTNFHGWQYQTASSTWKDLVPKGGVLRTVQGVMNEAVGGVVKHPVMVVGSSRTDSGVHAKGQVCHFDTTSVHIPLDGLRRAINARLPGDVVVLDLVRVPNHFDAISDAIHKRYQYLVWAAEERPVFREDMAFHRWQPIDVDEMKEAASYLVGTHDFASFAKPGHGRVHTVRTITGLEVSRRGKMLIIGVSGTGFLWNQIRIIAGTLIEVGLGRFRGCEVKLMLEAKDRRAAGSTAPAMGLYLQWIVHRNTEMDAPATEGQLVVPAADLDDGA